MADKEAPVDLFDPDVVIPESVKAAAAAAEAAHKAAYGDSVASNVDPQSTSNETIKLAEETLPTPPATAPTLDTPPAPSADQQERQPATTQQEVDWERRYNAMKGRHDHIVSENRQLAGRLGNLEQTLASMLKPPAQQQEQVDPTLDQITPEELSDYGEDFLNLVAKQARRTIAPSLSKLEQENAELRRQLGGVNTHIVRDSKVKLENYLDTHLTTWRDLNYNEEFLGWLAQSDPYSGQTRHNLLKQAYERNDAVRVLAFFNGFLADEAATVPQIRSATNGAGNGKSPPKVPLEKFAAPGRARTTASTPVEKPVIRRDQIAAFYAQVSAGQFDSNPAEKARLEAMIFDAQREGRIT